MTSSLSLLIVMVISKFGSSTRMAVTPVSDRQYFHGHFASLVAGW
jgi:hypothetical protein